MPDTQMILQPVWGSKYPAVNGSSNGNPWDHDPGAADQSAAVLENSCEAPYR